MGAMGPSQPGYMGDLWPAGHGGHGAIPAGHGGHGAIPAGHGGHGAIPARLYGRSLASRPWGPWGHPSRPWGPWGHPSPAIWAISGQPAMGPSQPGYMGDLCGHGAIPVYKEVARPEEGAAPGRAVSLAIQPVLGGIG
jgi:hypothetical protein